MMTIDAKDLHQAIGRYIVIQDDFECSEFVARVVELRITTDGKHEMLYHQTGGRDDGKLFSIRYKLERKNIKVYEEHEVALAFLS